MDDFPTSDRLPYYGRYIHDQSDGAISKEVMNDFLHLASKGYDIWAEAIGAKVRELVGAATTCQKSATNQPCDRLDAASACNRISPVALGDNRNRIFVIRSEITRTSDREIANF